MKTENEVRHEIKVLRRQIQKTSDELLKTMCYDKLNTLLWVLQ